MLTACKDKPTKNKNLKDNVYDKNGIIKNHTKGNKTMLENILNFLQTNKNQIKRLKVDLNH